MGTLANGEVVAPFANAAMRLLREDWKGKYGSKMLAEELFPILQTGIPQPNQNFQNFITVNAGEDGKLLSLIDKFGNEIYKVEEFGPNQINKGLQPVEPPGYPPRKLKPLIQWDAKTIAAGGSISGTELDAVAVDPETGATVAGAYVYDPVSGTTFASAGTATLYVNFTPTDMVKYRRAMGSTVLTITGAAVLLVPDINWSNPADFWLGTALSGTQLNATATDPVTFAPVAGVFDYTPPAGTILDIGDQVDDVFFTPTNTAVYDVSGREVAFIVKGIRIATAGLSGNSFTVAAGDVIVVGAYCSGLAGNVTVTVADGVNAYTQIGGYVRTNIGTAHRSTSLWYAIVTTPGTVTITVTPAGSSPGLLRSAIGCFEGILALDNTSSASGTGGETQSAGTCPVSGDRDLVFVFGEHQGTGFAYKTAWVVVGAAYSLGSRGNVGGSFGGPTPTAPLGGANVAVDPIASGTATDQWAFIAASFTHRTS